MRSALIGYTGFVGANLSAQFNFTELYNSKNIEGIINQHFDIIFCAGVPAAKWIANKHPLEDKQNIEKLTRCLSTATTQKFILISTVDVYSNPNHCDERTVIDVVNNQPYGKHRYEFEIWANNTFDTLTLRLPGLFGTGLKKNAIYDFLNNNQIDKIDSRGIFQFYHLDHLMQDINKANQTQLKLINIASEPMSIAEIAPICLGYEFENLLSNEPPCYNIKSIHAELLGGKNGYLYSKENVLNDLKKYVLQQKVTA